MRVHMFRSATSIALVAFLAATPLSRAAIPASASCMAHATQALDAVINGKYAAAGKHFAPQLAQVIDAGQIRKAWAEVQKLHGAYRGHAAAKQLVIGARRFVLIETRFANGPLNSVSSCNDSGQIVYSAWMFDAAGTIAAAQPRSFADGTRTLPLSVESPYGPLPATLTLPVGNGPFPAAVLLVGSGPQDQNESVGPNKPFRDLALGLARLGVATLRFDKRTYAYRLRAATSDALTVDDVVTDDAMTAVSVLRKQKHIDSRHVFVLGHSLGAMLAPRIGANDPHLAGLVLLAPPAVPVLEKAVRQVGHSVDAETDAKTKRALAAQLTSLRKELALVEHANPRQPPSGTFSGMPQSYWVSLHQVHPVAMVKHLRMPVLILQGGADEAVSPKYSFGLWQKAFAHNSRVTLKLYPGLVHTFLPVSKASMPAAANKPQHVDPRVIDDIAGWIQAQSKRTSGVSVRIPGASAPTSGPTPGSR